MSVSSTSLRPGLLTDLTRREFFAIVGRGIVVVFAIKDAAPAPQEASDPDRAFGPLPYAAIGSWLHINEEGAVTVYTGKVEVGQNIRTSLSQMVAEELRVPIAAVRLVMGDTDLTPYDIGSVGSLTTLTISRQLRKVAAAARELLLDLAAAAWQVDRSALLVAAGQIHHPETGRALDFGRLAAGQELVHPITDSKAVTPPDQWTVAGTSLRKVDGRAHVTGRHLYTSDMRLPGMVHGRILRPAGFEATLAALDTTQAAALPGVTVVRDGDFVGVTAPDEPTAARAVAAITATWQIPPQPSPQEMFDYFRHNPIELGGPGGAARHTAGAVAPALAAADHTLAHTYTVDYIANVPLEPRAALAEWVDGRLTVWTATQRPFMVRGELAQAFQVGEDRIRVIVPDDGSAYGGKHTGEAAIEAARLALAVGKPVKLVWTRQEEFTWATFRTAGVIDIASGVGSDGRLTAWELHAYNTGPNALQGRYEIPNQHAEFHPARSPLRQGSYRGMAATANNFARETHLDELAHLLKCDPLAFRYQNLTDARLRAVFAAAAEVFGWGQRQPAPDHGFGIAGGFEKGGYVATCAAVQVDRASGQVRVVHIVQAYECGAVINPDHLQNQIEGAIVQGLGGALFERITFQDGRILNPHFAQYRVPRFSDVPPIDVVVLDRKDLPAVGAGETPIIGIAPAIGNAIFAATGTRLRALPLVPDGLRR